MGSSITPYVNPMIGGGASFPASPVDKQAWLWTSDGWWYRWDAGVSLWLSDTYVPVVMQKRQAAEEYTSSAEAFIGPQPPLPLYIEGVDVGGFIGGTNDASNRWTWEFWGIAAGNSVTVLGSQFSTVWSANVWDASVITLSTGNPIPSGTYKDFELNLIKSGSAGGLRISVNVRARKYHT